MTAPAPLADDVFTIPAGDLLRQLALRDARKILDQRADLPAEWLDLACAELALHILAMNPTVFLCDGELMLLGRQPPDAAPMPALVD